VLCDLELNDSVAWVGFINMIEDSRPFGFWLGGKDEKRDTTLENSPVVTWPVYQGRIKHVRPFKNLLSYLMADANWEEPDVSAWAAAHGIDDSLSNERGQKIEI